MPSSLTLYAHQKRAVGAMIPKSMLCGADPGCGKTAIGLKLAEHFKKNPIRSGRSLVVAPKGLIVDAWIPDCAKFTPHLKITNLWSPTPAKRSKTLASCPASDIYCINPEGFKKILPWLEAKKFDIFIFDESGALANHRTDITKATLRFSASVPRFYPLSGTPMPNTPLDIWGQITCCDRTILPPNFYQFRAKYAYPCGYQGYDWKVTPEKREQLLRDIAPRVMFISSEDCLDLPKQTFVTRTVYMDTEQRNNYDKMVHDKILPLVNGKVAIASNVLSEIMKLRQITSGWLYDEDKKVYSFSDAKARVLDEVLSELGDRQAIIWVQFIHDADQLTSRLNADGIKAGKVIGGMDPEALSGRLNKFRSGELRYLVAHPKTMGHGVTLVNCRYAIYYSLSYSWQEYFQSTKRIHRIGQTQPVEYIHLLCKNSIDGAIYRAIQNKDDMAKQVVKYLKEADHDS